MMRTFLLFLAFGITGLGLPGGTQAQAAETLISTDVRHGGFGAPVFGVTSVNRQPSYLRGLRGAWILNLSADHSLALGLGSYRTQTEFDPVRWTRPGTDEPAMDTRYGGFELEYINQSIRLVHFGVQALLGSGNVRYRDPVPDAGQTSDNYFVLQPGVNLHLNVTRWFRLSGGLFYRYAGGVNLEGTGNSDLSGVTTFTALRFGKFQ